MIKHKFLAEQEKFAFWKQQNFELFLFILIDRHSLNTGINWPSKELQRL